MTDITESRDRMQIEIEEAKENIAKILSLVDYSLDELEDVQDPKILVLGIGPHFPEGKYIKEWTEENRKRAHVTTVERSSVDKFDIETMIGITESDFFKMKVVNSLFENFSFDSQYDLILLLRFSNFDLIPNSVFAKIVKAIKPNGTFIMSGGVTDRFGGYALQDPTINLEKRANVPFSFSDFYRSYPGTNLALKFKKVSDGV